MSKNTKKLKIVLEITNIIVKAFWDGLSSESWTTELRYFLGFIFSFSFFFFLFFIFSFSEPRIVRSDYILIDSIATLSAASMVF